MSGRRPGRAGWLPQLAGRRLQLALGRQRARDWGLASPELGGWVLLRRMRGTACAGLLEDPSALVLPTCRTDLHAWDWSSRISFDPDSPVLWLRMRGAPLVRRTPPGRWMKAVHITTPDELEQLWSEA